MNIRQYLLGMKDSDAEAAADLLDKEIQHLDIDSGCGETCKMVADATLNFSKTIDMAGWDGAEERWDAWHHCVRAMRVFFFG